MDRNSEEFWIGELRTGLKLRHSPDKTIRNRNRRRARYAIRLLRISKSSK